LPTTQGIIVLRRVLLDGESLADVWTDGALILLAVHSVVLFVVGLLVYATCERIAKRQGSLGQY
ncbi:MAG: ABC transporter permease, partial [Anaerolineae bacterium]|nr:ABC transporter permease [Anaerolineae bacterium]